MNINNIWYRKHWAALALMPLSILYRGVIRLRRAAYKKSWLSSARFDVPVIIVGNITVGGTGKTPLVAWLAESLRAQGFKPGLVSRGYKGQAQSWPQDVTASSDPKQVGDEPVMLVRKTQCPMMVGPDRVAAVRALLEKHDCNVVISDDGLQHYALGRSVEIAVIDGERQLGNRHCLPAGPLREAPERLKEVDFVVSHGESAASHLYFELAFAKIINLKSAQKRLSINALKGKTVHAIAGIGHPDRFFNMLEKQGIKVIRHAYPDHYGYLASDIDFDSDIILMTSKDAVKCQSFADERHYEVTVEAKPNSALRQALQTITSSPYPAHT